MNPPEAVSCRYSLLQKALRLIGDVFVDGNAFPAIAVGRLEWSFRFLTENRSERTQNRPLTCNLVRFLGLIGRFSA